MFFETEKPISFPFIHSLAPRIFELLTHSSDDLTSTTSSNLIKKCPFDVVMQALEIVQSLLDLTDSSKSLNS